MIPAQASLERLPRLRSGVAESSLQATREAQVKGTTVFGVGRDLVLTPSEEASRGHGRIKCRLGNCSVICFQDKQRDQATATADAIGRRCWKVQLVSDAAPMPMSGGGEQG